MKRRYIFRITSLALIAICIGIWVHSYFRESSITYYNARKGQYTFNIRCGLLYGRYYASTISSDETPKEPTYDPGWDWSIEPIRPETWELFPVVARHQFAGFAYEEPPEIEFSGMLLGVPTLIMAIPLWFTTVLSGLLAIYVWRKTRLNPATAFPVEISHPK